MKHTKGPWSIKDESKNLDLYRIIKPNGEHGLAIVNTKADANLIAAAPELLRELKSAIFYIETYGSEVTSNFSAAGNLSAVKTVISKAEGNEK